TIAPYSATTSFFFSLILPPPRSTLFPTRRSSDLREWHVKAANARALADTLCREWDHAVLFRRLATLRTDITLFEDVDQLRWSGPTPAFDELAARLDGAHTEIAQRSRSEPIVRSAARSSRTSG